MKNLQTEHLRHHGVKGMKWHVRRYQNSDGSLTAAGKKRYDVDIDAAKQRVKDANAAVIRSTKAIVYSPKELKIHNDAIREANYAKEDLRTEKAKAKLNKEKGTKSNYRLKLEEQYKKKGMSQEEAEVAAYRKARTQKALAVVGATTVAAAGAYVAYKHYDKNVDRILQKDKTTFQRIVKSDAPDSNNISRAFYAVNNKGDKELYAANFPEHLAKMGAKPAVLNIGLKDNVKVASEKSGKEALKELLDSDPEFRQIFTQHMEQSEKLFAGGTNPAMNKAVQQIKNGALKNGTVTDDMYRAFNQSLVLHKIPTSEKVNNSFYDKLKSKGYDAIIDVNDKYYSGYKAKRPTIVFNPDKVKLVSQRDMGKEEIKKTRKTFLLKRNAKDLARMGLGTAGASALQLTPVMAGTYYIQKKRAQRNDEIVKEYKKKHPNSDLSYTEIVRNYERSRQ